ncbi:hypothetical protein GBAR_LOCUS6077, partial [Geodia barretti]
MVYKTCGYNFAAWTLSARVKSLVSLRALTRVSHVTGSPFPLSHSPRMLREMLSGSPRFLYSIMFTLSPVSSLRRKIPNLVWLVAIPSGFPDEVALAEWSTDTIT